MCLDLLPRRPNCCQGKNQQRNQQGSEENQSLRWAACQHLSAACSYILPDDSNGFLHRFVLVCFSWAVYKRGALLIRHLQQGSLQRGVWVRPSPSTISATQVFSWACTIVYLFMHFTANRETVNSNSTLEKTFQITPLLSNNKEKRGLSVDGRLKDGDTHLASTTL